MVLLKLNNEMSNQRTLCRRFSEFVLSVRRFSRDENANLGFKHVTRVGGKSQVAAVEGPWKNGMRRGFLLSGTFSNGH